VDVIGAPTFELSTSNCTLAIPTLSVALAVNVVVPDKVAFADGAVMDTVGGVLSASVENVMSPLFAVTPCASVDVTRK